MSSDPPSDPQPPTSDPVPSLSDPISSDTTTQAELSTADIRAQVEHEQALSDALKRVREVEEQCEKIRGEKRGLEDEKEGAVQATNQLRTQLSALQSSYHTSTSELSVLQTRIEIIEREKKELYEETERLQERSSRSNQELYTLRAQKSESAQKIARLDVEVSEQRMAAESAKFNEERSIQALEAARTENLRIGKTYTDLEERFGKYRAEKQSQISSLQTDHDILLSRLTTAESSYQALQRSYNEQANRLASAFADISNLTSAAASRKASSQSEAYRLADENRVLERRAEDARATIAEREAELERIVVSHEVEKRDWEAKWKSEERRRREVEKREGELRQVVDKITLASGEGTDLSPAAALAGEMRGNGKSYTQFFTDYTVQEGRLREAENEIQRLTDLLDEIGNDIAEKKPLLDEQAAEHAAAIDRANALAAELAMVMTTRDGYEETVKSLRAATAHHAEEVSGLQSTADDLSRQVQNLLRQLAIRDDPSLANLPLDAPAPGEGDIITDNFLEFRSLRGLQENNQKLLKLTRALMAKLDQREIRRATAEEDDVNTGETLDQATETIQRLHKQLLEANRKINESVRERDFFSKLLARGEGLKWSSANASAETVEDGPHTQTIEMLRTEIEGVRVKAEEELRTVKVELRNQEEKVGQAEVAKARAEVKVSMLEEQTRSLTDANNLQKQRGEGLEGQIRQIQASIATAQNEARMAQEQVALRQAEADRLRMDVAVLRAEKEQWSSTEARLQADFRSVQTERAKLQQLIDNHSNVSAEGERSRSEERGRFEKRIDELTRETTALRSQIEQIRAATRAAEQKVADADSALEAAVSSVRKEKETAETLAASRRTEIASLQADLAKSREGESTKHRIGLNWKRQHDTLKDTLAGQAGIVEGKDNEIREIRTKLDEANKGLEEGKAKLADVEKRLEGVTRSEQLKEGTVQRLQAELTQARSKAGGGGADGAAIATLQAEKDSLQARVSQLEKDLEEAKSASSATNATPALASGDGDAELRIKIAELTSQHEELTKRYEENVTKVNRINASMRNRISELTAEKSEGLTKIAELERRISELESASASGAQTEVSGTDQSKIDEAVKSAVAAKQAELDAAIESAKSSGSTDTAAIDAAVKAKETELNSTIESRIAESIAQQESALEAEKAKLQTETEELQVKIKSLEKQARTAEISRKTLERQKDAAEAKLKKFEAGSTAGDAAAGTGLSPGAAAFTPSTPSTSTSTTTAAAGLAPVPAKPATAGNAAPAATGGAAVRGTAVRGRGRGTAVRGGAVRGGAPRPSVLENVNATLSAAQPASAPAPSPPPATAAQKRPAPEEGEITDPSSASTDATGAGSLGDGSDVLARLKGGEGARGRVLKRPRGAAPARGGATGAGRRTSTGAAATTAGQGQPTQESQGGSGGNGISGEGNAGESGAGAGASGEGSGDGPA